MEAIIRYLWVFGAATIVSVIIFIDIIRRKKSAKPYIKWITVILLSIWQVSCWQWLDTFDGRFGNSAAREGETVIFATIVIAWLLSRLIDYIRTRTRVVKGE